MKRLKRPAAWITAAFLIFGLATLGNISYAADETPENGEVLKDTASAETVTASEQEKLPDSQDQTEILAPQTEKDQQDSSDIPEKQTSTELKKDTTSPTAADPKTETAKVQKTKKAASEDPGILIEGSTLYAQGTSIVIKKDSDGKAYVFDASGNTRLSDTPVTGSFTVYGGGKNKPTKGNVNIDIQNVQVSQIYGGGYSDGTGASDLTGNVSIKVTGTVNVSKVYGGGYASASKGNASANVSGAVTVDIASVPSGNHGNLYGGGYAYTTGSYNASANAGSVSISVTGRTYSLRGGGSATSSGDGKASADVAGSVSCTMRSVDIREVYSGGYASGSGAHAKCGSITSSFAGNGNEVMIFHGAGDAGGGACADVSGNVTANLTGCSNIYGYVTAGGTASGGGSADVNGSVSLNVINSVSPVGEQWGNPVAAAFHTGGSASGQGSSADVKGSCSSVYRDSEIVGTIVGGGESAGGGSAKSAKTSLTLDNVKGSEYKDTMYYGDYIAAGEVDDESSKSLAEPSQSTISVSNSQTELLWGGLLLKGHALSSETVSELILKDSISAFDEIAHFDSLSISHPITLASFEPKSDTVPTTLKTSGLAVGDTIVTYTGSNPDADWFKLKNGKLAYKQSSDLSSWSIASFGTASGSIAVEQPSRAPAITLENTDTDKFLTADDKQKIADGSTVEIVLKSEPVTAPPADIQKLLKEQMDRTQTHQASILDINLLKVTDGAPEKIPVLDSPLKITFQVPEEFQKEGRQFQVIRIHQEDDGSSTAEVLNNLSTEPDKVTIETDRFSVYTLVYKDPLNSSAASSAAGSENTPASTDDRTSGGRQTAVRKRPVTGNASAKSNSHKSSSKGSRPGSLGSPASTSDANRGMPSLLLILSGSLICAGFLIKRQIK
ncbi:hypothetical protein [Anaerostipes sp.]|uniref:hypothetical protein n=1 Tax=Anaerostipes sp. TaxID=1872530 RepID=UPI0025BA0EFC|nr:hypothetical protein [Anaerostipes sp.]MBS7008918.1 hypothetical protein [Anaerostipes sp.]